MSRIQQVKPEYRQFSGVSNYRNGIPAANTSFGRNEQELAEVAQKVSTAAGKKVMTPAMKVYDFLALNEGELENQLISNVFTATLAPLVIAYNPFSNKSKEDKQYVAWRQPLSAVIALAGGLPATILINKGFSKLGSEGYFKGMDFRMCPNGDYLKPKFEEEFAAHSKADASGKNTLGEFAKKIKMEADFSTSVSKLNIFPYLYNKAKFKDAFVKKENDDMTRLFSAIISFDEKDIEINEITNADNKIVKEISIKGHPEIISKAIPGMESMSDIKAYREANSINNYKLSEFMKKKFDFEFHGDGSLKQTTTKSLMSSTLAKDFLEKIGMYEKIDAETIARICAKARGSKAEGVDADTQKVITRQIHDNLGESEISKSKISLNQFFERLGLINAGKEEEKLAQLQKLMNMNLAEVWSTLKSHLEANGESFEKNIDEAKVKMTNFDFACNFMKKLAKDNSERFKNYNKLNGIVGNLIVVILTCTALNWTYPRFMDKFFPNLSKKPSANDVKKGGNK